MRRNLEELEFVWVKVEDKKIGKRKKSHKARSSNVYLFPPEEKTVGITENMEFVAHLTTGCGFSCEVGLRN